MVNHHLSAEAPDTGSRTRTRTRTPHASHGRLHLLLSLISLVVVLVSVNRKSGSTLAFVADNEFLRWAEVDNMVLGLCTVVLYHLVTAHLRSEGQRNEGQPSRPVATAVLGVLLVVGAYTYALSFGDHEVTNYLNGRFCSGSSSTLCGIVAFNDDVFSDILFLAGFTVLNVVTMLTQSLFPSPRPMRPLDNLLIGLNALFIAAGITANLAFEKAVFDPFVVGATAVLALVLLKRSPRQPILRYYAVAYTLGILATAVLKSL